MVDLVKREWALFSFILLMVLLSVLYPWKMKEFPHYIHWETIATLCGLLMVVTGIKESGYLEEAGCRLLEKSPTLRSLAVALCVASALASTVLTNDITLFIAIPLTLSLRGVDGRDLEKLIVFEAIAVNSGSALTPIGNPQNMYLWHVWDVSFLKFCGQMAPVVAIMLASLTLFIWVSFPEKEVHPKPRAVDKDRALFILSAITGIFYIAAVELDLTYPATAALFILFLLFRRRILAKVDWLLLALFGVIFIDFTLMADIPMIRSILARSTGSPEGTYIASIAASQLVSNVPAAVLMSKLSNHIKAIAYGVNIGGNGTVLGSLANVIALRMLNRKNSFLRFHLYSIPFLICTGLMTLLLF